MFNVGSEDKEKLRENMEEIKDLIQGRDEDSSEEFEPPQETEPSPQDNGFDSDTEPSNLGSNQNDSVNQVEQSGGDGFMEESDEDIDSGIQQNSGDAGFQENNNEEPNMGQDTGNGFGQREQNQGQQSVQNQGSSNQVQQTPQQNNIEQSNQQQTGNPLQQSAQRQPRDDNQKRNESQVVNSSGMQESNQRNEGRPSGSGSQKLFLEVERFEKVKDMIDEMQQLTSEIEDTSEDLESQIDRERESENQAQQLLENFSDRKNQVEDVVLDSEEN